MSHGFIKSFALAVSTVLGATGAAGVDVGEGQKDVFEKPVHIHEFVCSKSGAIWKIGFDLSISQSDAERLGYTPEALTDYLRSNIVALATKWRAGWDKAAKDHDLKPEHINDPQSPMAKAVSDAIAPDLKAIEDKSGVTLRVNMAVEGFVVGSGLDCRDATSPAPKL